MRLTLLERLVQEFPQHNREELLADVMCGKVFVNSARERDPKRRLSPSDRVELPGEGEGFASRAALKLDSLLADWNVAVENLVWLDAGCASGGFTDVLLRRGARTVHAVDIAYNVLDWKIRNDPRVVVHERCNIMGLDSLEPAPDAAVADLSFRSLERAARKILGLCKNNVLVALIKPQFERKYSSLGDEGFDGILAESELGEVMRSLMSRLAAEFVLVHRIARTPIKGRKGNQELLALLSIRESHAGLEAANLAVLSQFMAGGSS